MVKADTSPTIRSSFGRKPVWVRIGAAVLVLCVWSELKAPLRASIDAFPSSSTSSSSSMHNNSTADNQGRMSSSSSSSLFFQTKVIQKKARSNNYTTTTTTTAISRRTNHNDDAESIAVSTSRLSAINRTSTRTSADLERNRQQRLGGNGQTGAPRVEVAAPSSFFAAVTDPPDVHTTNNSTKLHADKILIIGAGRGTTGTHLMFETTCHLGIPSYHWNLGCIPPLKNNHTSALNKKKTNDKGTVAIPNSYIAANVKHRRLTQMVAGLQRCVDQRKKAKCGKAILWRQAAWKKLEAVVADGRITALHDNPYPYLLPQTVSLAHRYYDKVLVLLSERDPAKYAQRRVEQSYGRSDPICIPYFNGYNNEHDNQSNSDATSRNNTAALPGAYDLIGCIDYAVAQAANSSEAAQIDLLDLFTSLRNVIEGISVSSSSSSSSSDGDGDDGGKTSDDSKGFELIAQSIRDYQDEVRTLSNFAFDMFKRPEKTQKEDLAREIVQHVPELAAWLTEQQEDDHRTVSSQPQPAQYVNWWQRILIPDIPSKMREEQKKRRKELAAQTKPKPTGNKNNARKETPMKKTKTALVKNGMMPKGMNVKMKI